MTRVPDTGPEVRDREKVVEHLKEKLAYFRSIPPHRREAECADEGVRDCIALLREHVIDAE